ncbi:hypothetical protein FISHEDRAFT_42625 [Fistulina hepatica ATCC 64428]|uniref:Rab-GAP TBC domain-containing protein n=1 Tax=Fistulina hepatica ATCC 64428 TaxID=1128425 RepID=A0A0D7ADP1_9AGAR|nr:hypothetical protein FISHEDRAFT_42625 [Fistulina hepatica ATCC 64428]
MTSSNESLTFREANVLGSSEICYGPPSIPALEAHPDERQIQLDTDRSFVLYPVDRCDDRERLQSKLHDLIVSVFRKRPGLSYFQGYHDIISVLFLTLPEELQFKCAEKMSLHRLRDNMGAGLEPVLGLLRVTRNLLRLCDPAYAKILEQTSPLPHFALSNLLTLFAHDMPTLPLIQHVFDYLLAREPITIIYLATAIILQRKEEAESLKQKDEEGMMHSLLSSLPRLKDEPFDNDREFLPLEEAKPSLESDQSCENSQPCGQNSEFISSLYDSQVKGEPQVKHEELEPSIPSFSNVKEVEKDTGNPGQNPAVSLSSLLERADALYALYPPSHAALRLPSIMGPQSVVFTWSPTEPLSDDEAERMVKHPELVVYPSDDDEREEKERADEEFRKKAGKGRLVRRRRPEYNKSVVKRRGMMTLGAVFVLALGLYCFRDEHGRSSRMLVGHSSRLPEWTYRLLARWV